MNDPGIASFTDEQRYAMRLFRTGKQSVLLMGVAGAGKSLLIRKYIAEQENQFADIAIVAPTGVAAVNIGGTTIHSLFQLSPGALDPDDEEGVTGKWSKIEILIIDEISMVRADVFACIDRRLRAGKSNYNAQKPFGGVRIIMVGDVCQLDPIMPKRGTDEHEFLMDHFGSGWFFDTKEFRELNPTPIFLTKSFRQEELSLSNMLDRVRVGDRTAAKDLNDALQSAPDADGSNGPVVCCTNRQVDDINSIQLAKLEGEVGAFQGILSGKFKPNDCRTDVVLELKVGARVLAVANNYEAGFINGDAGTVVSLAPLVVDFDRHGERYVNTFKWESIRYTYEHCEESKRKRLQRMVVGQFIQVPLRLGWAITIHKSQGMGFAQMTVDMGKGAFASGQTYVALSRSMTLEGLTLKVPIRSNDIFTDRDALKFHELMAQRSVANMQADSDNRR